MKTKSKDALFQWVNCLIFGLFALICIYPFYYIVINSISANNLVDRGQIILFPRGLHFNNYVDVLKKDNVQIGAVVSVLRTVVGTAVQVFSAAYMAYFFTKKKMWFRRTLYRAVVITMYFGAGMIPVYLNIKALGLLNSFWVYIIPGLFPVYNMILIKTFMESIPASLEESAEIDGAGYLTRFLRIMMPLSLPIIATVALWGMVGQWNSYMDTLLYITNYKLYTLQFVLYQLLQQAETLAVQAQQGGNVGDIANSLTPTSFRMTVTVVVTLPIMLVYPFMQKYFVGGIMIGAVKG